MNLVQEKVRQRNITPNFLRFRRKSTTNSIGKKTAGDDRVESQPTSERTDRSTSRASRCSFEAYEPRVLHLSKLQKPINHHPHETDEHPLKKNHILTGDHAGRQRGSDSAEKPLVSERAGPGGNSNNFLQKLKDERKRNSASGKISNKIGGRTSSIPKRTQQSLEKEDQRAKQMNAELMTNMKNQFAPNYINKLKMKKLETSEKKRPAKGKMLNLIVAIKGEEEMKNYEIYGELGKGAYGVVRMGLDKRTNEKIAIKIYEKKKIDEPNKVKNLEREINLLAELSHQTIAKLLDVVETQSQLYLVLEYGGANSLYNYLLSKPEHRLSEHQAKQFLIVISEALMYLHGQDVVHRDIKAENILINRHRQFKLIDFGFSLRCKRPNTIDTFCGTPTYMAPEIVSKVDHCPIYTDMWSLGVLFYVILQGNYPFRAKSESELFQKIKKGQFEYIHNDTSKECKRLIESLLRVNPLDRLTIQELLSKENRAWLETP